MHRRAGLAMIVALLGTGVAAAQTLNAPQNAKLPSVVPLPAPMAVPSKTAPAKPTPAKPVPVAPVPAKPVPAKPVPAKPVPVKPAAVTWHTDIDAAWTLAKQQQRPMLIYVSAKNCSWCVRMARETLADAGLQTDVTASCIAVRLDQQTADRELLKKLGVRVYPTTLIVSPQAKILSRTDGYVTAHDLRQKLRATTEQVAARSTTDKR